MPLLGQSALKVERLTALLSRDLPSADILPSMLDLIVVGGGIVGLATAFRYSARFPGRSTLLIEKEDRLASHQSGHNSGVLHSGIYYPPGSLKARNCRRGKQLLEDFCRESGVSFETPGKLIIARDEGELPRLAELRDRGRGNGVQVEELDHDGIRRLEPQVGGVAGLHIPESGVVDYREVCGAFSERLEQAGGRILTGTKVHRIHQENGLVRLHITGGGEWIAKRVIVCGGLQSDRLAQHSNIDPGVRIVPFLGEYRSLKPEYAKRVTRLIYPVPDPRFPFLGVHLTPRIGGGVDCGPNALPTLSREGYSKLSINPRDALDTLGWPGFWRLAARQLPMAAREFWRSLTLEAFAKDLSRLLPGARADWLEKVPSGVRAQALDRRGELVDDFLTRRQGALLHLLNAPSPAATSCLSIAEDLLETPGFLSPGS
jgi:(S)-2-hydroxyglutarate dehydrogenase